MKIICVQCKKNVTDRDRKRCAECIQKRRDYKVSLKQRGICQQCSTRQAVAGSNKCQPCRQAYREWQQTRKRQGLCGYRACPNNARQGKRLCDLHAESASENQRRTYHELRRRIIDAYGGRCACCGESAVEFLTLDHVDGLGTQIRQRQSFQSEARKLLALGCPSSHQILCYNCNHAKWIYGKCPHGAALGELLGTGIAQSPTVVDVLLLPRTERKWQATRPVGRLLWALRVHGLAWPEVARRSKRADKRDVSHSARRFLRSGRFPLPANCVVNGLSWRAVADNYGQRLNSDVINSW